jgi:hypothetical protein
MLDADADAAEAGVVVGRDVAGGVDVWATGAEAGVDDDAVSMTRPAGVPSLMAGSAPIPTRIRSGVTSWPSERRAMVPRGMCSIASTEVLRRRSTPWSCPD